jgi:tagatose-6-phosphate ketose/aldose isomerase
MNQSPINGELSDLASKYFTAGEIYGQPHLWRNLTDGILDEKSEIESFLRMCIKKVDYIVLTGAGTSSYIGLSLQGLFYRHSGKITLSIPTTDIVTHPADYFSPDKTVLLISFARSGNSPESIAAVELTDKLCGDCFHMVITCDARGNLARYETRNKKYLLVLPTESNDRGLAMTGSYSGMLLAGILIARIFNIKPVISQIDLLCKYGSKILENYSSGLKQIASKDFKRGIFLGSGPFYGTAAESHLKLQELTNGIVMCKRESFLGLRHGPKAIIHPNSLVYYIFSNNPYVNQYETDMVHAIQRDHVPNAKVGICELPCKGMDLDLFIDLSEMKRIDEYLLAVCYVLPAQILGFYKSLQLGMNPDNPSANNVISRVVEGVKIYNFTTISDLV